MCKTGNLLSGKQLDTILLRLICKLSIQTNDYLCGLNFYLYRGSL